MRTQKRIHYGELCVLCLVRGKSPDDYRIDSVTRTCNASLSLCEVAMMSAIRNGFYNSKTLKVKEVAGILRVNYLGNDYSFPRHLPRDIADKGLTQTKTVEGDLKYKTSRIEELEALLEIKNGSSVVEIHDIAPCSKSTQSESVAIVLLSDAHIEEEVKSESVLGLNEYNLAIAQERMDSFFSNAVKLITHAQRSYNINHVVLACLGDIIGNWIHEELMQTNSMSPLEAISTAKSMILSGLKHWQENLNVDKVTFIGVVGNHGRNSKKNQYANSTEVNLEYFMYKDIEEMSKVLGLDKFEFIIPRSEMITINIFDKRLLFTHGTHIKYQGGIGGLFPPLLRWFSRLAQVLKVDMAIIGHFHTSIFTKKFIVNGSLKGYDAYAMGHGLDFEPPQQTMIILNQKRGFTSYTPIFMD